MSHPPHPRAIITPTKGYISAGVWCGLALLYAIDDNTIWHVQLPRGKPKQVYSLPGGKVEFQANNKFVLLSWRDGLHLLLFARDGSLLYDSTRYANKTAAPSQCQLTGSGLAVYDKATRSVTTWPGGQSHAVDSRMDGIAARSTNLATPVFYWGGHAFNEATLVDGAVVTLYGHSWVHDARTCMPYEVYNSGIKIHYNYMVGLLALWRWGLPLTLRWHIMDF
jgi:hypothetical protein